MIYEVYEVYVVLDCLGVDNSCLLRGPMAGRGMRAFDISVDIGSVVLVEEEEVLRDEPFMPAAFIDIVAREGREMEDLSSWSTFRVRDLGSLLSRRGAGGAPPGNSSSEAAGGAFSS